MEKLSGWNWWVEKAAHPALLLAALGLWLAMGMSESAALLALVGAQIVLALLERSGPAVPRWRQRTAEKWTLIGIYAATLVAFGVVIALYDAALAPSLAAAREAFGLDLWPRRWPVLAQVVLLYFASDFIYYWIHRAIHGSGLLWRVSGHGFHHAFQNLHAINAGATHPLEVFFLALPMVLIAALFGGTAEAVAGAGVLLVVNSSVAHANVRTDTPVLRWFITTSAQHRRHHSAVLVESNSNFSCNAILWDRLFGTYSEGDVEQTGIGPAEPSFLEKLLLPIREPGYAITAASTRHARNDDSRPAPRKPRADGS